MRNPVVCSNRVTTSTVHRVEVLDRRDGGLVWIPTCPGMCDGGASMFVNFWLSLRMQSQPRQPMVSVAETRSRLTPRAAARLNRRLGRAADAESKFLCQR